MRNSIKKKNIIAIIVAILCVGVSLTVPFALAQSNITIRPLSEWVASNPRVVYGFGGDDPNSDEDYFIFFSYPWLFPDSSWYNGYIKERATNDGGAIATVYITINDWEIPYIWRYDPTLYGFPFFGYDLSMVTDLKVSGTFRFNFLLPYPGAPIPSWFQILIFDPDQITDTLVQVSGTGVYSEFAGNFGYTPGTTAKVHVIMRPLTVPNPPPQHSYPGDPNIWPVEIVSLT